MATFGLGHTEMSYLFPGIIMCSLVAPAVALKRGKQEGEEKGKRDRQTDKDGDERETETESMYCWVTEREREHG